MANAKGVFRDALMRLCETKELSKITVKDVVEEAGLARQTFYNNFYDINELIAHTGIHPFASQGISIADLATVRFALEFALRHKAFYSQLPHRTGQNDFRESLFEWMYQSYYQTYVAGVECDEHRTVRDLLVRYSLHGGVDLLYDWLKTGMQWPIDAVVEAVRLRRCDFHDPSLMPVGILAPGRVAGPETGQSQ